jgi:hypothetical protein
VDMVSYLMDVSYLVSVVKARWSSYEAPDKGCSDKLWLVHQFIDKPGYFCIPLSVIPPSLNNIILYSSSLLLLLYIKR